MKKLLLIFASIAIIGIAKADSDDQPIDFKNLPKTAQSFVSKYFKTQKVVNSTIDKEILNTEYTVHLSDGSQIDFDEQGRWIEVNCKTSQVPVGIIASAIQLYVRNNYANSKIIKIDSKSSGYEIKLSTGQELIFSQTYEFLGIDK